MFAEDELATRRGGPNMSFRSIHLHSALGILAALCATAYGRPAAATPEYHPITPSMEAKTITLTGHDLTIDQIIAVARYGAKVQYGPGVLERANEARELKLEADAEGIAVYGVNRGSGSQREVNRKESAESVPPAMLDAGMLPEIDDEALVRATILIGANSVGSAGTGQDEARILLDLLNKRVTPVAYSRGTLGEADFPAISNNITATVNGQGEAYYRGARMSAAEALRQAGLKPVATGFFGGGAENAYGDANAALLVADGRHALEWADLIDAMNLLGMNSSLTPMASPAQAKRPFKWVNWDAARILDMLKGSYLFEVDPKRVLQDPQSLRSVYIRQGSAWQAWARLRDSVELQINSADLNPLAVVGAAPTDGWELSTPQFMKFYVKGGELSHGKHGYVFSTANWDPYPLANDVEAFTNAVANMDAPIAQIIERLTERSPTAFFTGVKPQDVLPPEQLRKSPSPPSYVVFMDLWAEIQNESRSITPEGNAADIGVADTEGFTRLKGVHGRTVVDLTMQLLALDLLTATYWMDIRSAQDSTRKFGDAPTAAWGAFRKLVPWQQEPSQRPQLPYGIVAYGFLKSTPVTTFYGAGPAMPESPGQP
jgi:histidine ammonia-lyase